MKNANELKPHICFVSETEATYGILTGAKCNAVGGAEVQQLVLAEALRGRGYRVTFLVPDLGQPPVIVTASGITVRKTRKQFAGSGLKRLLVDSLKVFAAMRRAGADVYYQRCSSVMTGVTAFYCKLAGKPFVFSVAHNKDVDESLGRFLSFKMRRLYKYGVTNADAVVVQTKEQKDLLKKWVGIDGVHIPSSFHAPKETDSEVVESDVLWAGTFKSIKRPEMFVELAAMLPQYKFLMLGGPGLGEEALYTDLQSRSHSIPNLKLTGLVPYSEVGKYFAGTKIFVNTSISEGFPNTYLQAWCRGVPVVATFDADGLISTRSLGRCVSDQEELKSSVGEFLRDSELRLSAGERALKYVKDNHSIEAVVGRYDELFMRLFAEAKSRS
ncbi:MAG: glycosyltransferase family 4 protein [Armatimonadota bacterium]